MRFYANYLKIYNKYFILIPKTFIFTKIFVINMKKKLIKKRLENGLSQEKLADLIGMTQSNYSRRENGLKKITDQEWLKIAKELGVKKEDIYQEDTLKLDINEINLQEYSIPDVVLHYIESLKKENSALKKKK